MGVELTRVAQWSTFASLVETSKSPHLGIGGTWQALYPPAVITTTRVLLLVGALLEIAGVLTIGYGVKHARETFAPERPGIAGTVRRRVTLAWRHVRQSITRRKTVSATPTLAVESLATATGRASIPIESTVDWDTLDTNGRLGVLRRQVAGLEETTRRLETKLDNAFDALGTRITSEVGRIATSVENVDQHLSMLATGMLRLQAGGVALLLAGILLTLWGSALGAG